MHISNSFANHATSLFKESILPSLTAQQKKILVVVSIALGFLTALYVANRYYFQNKVEYKSRALNEHDKIDDFTKDVFKDSNEGDLKSIRKITDEKSGTVYEGEFKGGKLIKGKITYRSGIISEGEFENDTLNGNGKISYKNILISEGKFRDGTLNGKGTITHLLSGKVEEGEFRDNILMKGKVTYADGPVSDGIVKEGEFKDGKLIKGKITYLNGNVFEGEFENEKLNGNGKVTYKDIPICEGKFENGIFMNR